MLTKKVRDTGLNHHLFAYVRCEIQECLFINISDFFKDEWEFQLIRVLIINICGLFFYFSNKFLWGISSCNKLWSSFDLKQITAHKVADLCQQGMTILWLTAMIPELKPSRDQSNQLCESATAAQLVLLFVSFGLMSIGAGCIRPCSIAFGAEQLDSKENPSNERVLESFFSWYYTSTGVSAVLALTAIMYIQDHLGCKVGFGVPW